MPRASNRPTPQPEPLPVHDRPADPPRRSLRSRPEEPRERQYVVTGPKVVGGKGKGERVTLCLTDAAEYALILAGHVKPVAETERPSVANTKGSD